MGNLGQTVCTELNEEVIVDIPVRNVFVKERVRDVDVYAPYLG